MAHDDDDVRTQTGASLIPRPTPPGRCADLSQDCAVGAEPVVCETRGPRRRRPLTYTEARDRWNGDVPMTVAQLHALFPDQSVGQLYRRLKGQPVVNMTRSKKVPKRGRLYRPTEISEALLEDSWRPFGTGARLDAGVAS